jgi:GPH family glycoside/pentoside/hexuronide:cation symporter
MSLSEKNQMAIEEKPLKLKDTILYNMAAFSLNVYDTILATWLLFFFVPPEDLGHVRYIPMVVLATIMAGGRILDAITDPLIGYMSDHTGSRWGRRKPYIFISSPILFLTFILVWLPPVNSTSNINALFLGVVLFVYYWAYTGVLIPWFAVLPELSKENRGRVKIATIGVAIGVIGALVGGGLSGPLLEKFGAFKMAVILGATAFIACELTLFGIKERHPVQSIKGSAGFGGFLQVLKQVFSDKQVLCFSITIMLVQLTYQLMLMNVPYFTTLILKQEESMASYLMAVIITIIALSTPMWYWLLNKYPKRNVFRVIMLIMMFGYVLAFFAGRIPTLPVIAQTIAILAIVSIPMGGMFTVALGLIADLTDYDELKSGQRREAVYYGIYGIVRKTGWAACSLIMVAIFSGFGFTAQNPMGVRVIWLVCALACLLGFLVFIPYRVGDSKQETGSMLKNG